MGVCEQSAEFSRQRFASFRSKLAEGDAANLHSIDFAYSVVWSALCSIHAINKEFKADKKKKEKLLKNFVFNELRSVPLQNIITVARGWNF